MLDSELWLCFGGHEKRGIIEDVIIHMQEVGRLTPKHTRHRNLHRLRYLEPLQSLLNFMNTARGERPTCRLQD